MIEERFMASFINCYFIGLGVLLGGVIIGGLGAFLVGQPPLTMMVKIEKGLKIWAIVAAIGGTFDAITNFQRGIFYGETLSIFKQILLIIAAMGGTHTASLILHWLTQEQM
ncbi:YtrH family sporulation protein [Bacillus solimangrovi]|uniref:Sporulation protein n=1 Tax=Bacillus solimangrovi TaxID=1305675 RepID=A0A1E5LCQ4_9BACI|nr:YtrH family sporulation protein [Bacillus solimangrovi]OEH91850.1 sporulation protein [Bacillus solimangrovi]